MATDRLELFFLNELLLFDTVGLSMSAFENLEEIPSNCLEVVSTNLLKLYLKSNP